MLKRILRRILRQTNSSVSGADTQTNRVIQSTVEYDMYKNPDEAFYREQYWHWIQMYLEKFQVCRSGKFADVGCSQGRLSLQLARWAPESHTIGIDLSPHALRQAEMYAAEEKLVNVEFKVSGATEWLKGCEDGSFDVVLMTEVIFFFPGYAEALAEIPRVLKKGGLFFVSFRSRYFNLLHAVSQHQWESAGTVLTKNCGKVFGPDVTFTWHSPAEARKEVELAGLTLIGMYGIGVASGIQGDPLSRLARPSELNSEDRRNLLQIELSAAQEFSGNGRYILCVCTVP